MEFAIKGEEPVNIGPTVYLGLESLEALNVGVRQVRYAFGDCQGLDTFTNLINIETFLAVKFGDPGSAVRPQSDQPFGLQDPQCLADREPAGSETGGDLLLHDPLAGRKRAFDDLGSQIRR